MADQALVARLAEKFEEQKHNLELFMEGNAKYFEKHPDLKRSKVVHSYKFRLKDDEGLKRKLHRKLDNGRDINEDNFFTEVTDLAGVRVLLLFQDDFGVVDAAIRERVNDGYWVFGERPKAYTWDPEAAAFFGKFDLAVEEKPTFYTSVHYLVRPRTDSPVCCEIQVRTLFEEIWGEVDHQINYPTPTDNLSCREQIMVLSKIVGAGSRLLDSLRRVRQESDGK